ncbi:MAG: NUDIX domain-containing protein [Acidobacteriota bacterium]
MLVPTKACPIVIRNVTAPELLVFRHPRSGIQLVKGTIEPGEHPRDTAVRELREESGIESTIEKDLGVWNSGFDGQIWSVYLCATPPDLPETWRHFCTDGGGLDLEFFWHDLHAEPTDEWHPLYRAALRYVRAGL